MSIPEGEFFIRAYEKNIQFVDIISCGKKKPDSTGVWKLC